MADGRRQRDRSAGTSCGRCCRPGRCPRCSRSSSRTSHRHFAMKLLLPEAAEKPDAPAHAVPRGRGRHQAAHPNVIRILKVSRDPHDARTSSWSTSRPGRLRTAAAWRKDFAFIKEHARTDLQAGGHRAGLHERQRLGPPRREAGQHAGERGRARRRSSTSPSPSGSRTGLVQAASTGREGRRGRRATCRPSRSASEPLDGRADIYSSAARCYELTTGRPPFRGSTIARTC